MLRRAARPAPERHEVGDLVVDLARHEVTVAGAAVDMTPAGFTILTRLATDLAEQAVAAHRARAEACDVDLTVSRADPLTVHADPARLRQALGNLVSNAIRHTPPGGTVTVTVTGEADAVVFTVSDNGSGIAEEHLPHIFDRFYRADPTAGGGLGLAITKHLV
jgi:two-component system, OmpR family, sensor histidine kinase BaeS